MKTTCLQMYYQPIYLYIKKAISLAFNNDSTLLLSASAFSIGTEILQDFFNVNYFGVNNLTLLLVIGTILLDANYGIKKSIKESKIALKNYNSIVDDTPEKRALYKAYELKKFNPLKLQYTFFKALTLLGYLFFVKSLINSNIEGDVMLELIGFGSVIVLKAPIIIFWYYDFKSIGENTEFLYGKKAPIFSIVESIFEFRISNFLNKNKQ